MSDYTFSLRRFVFSLPFPVLSLACVRALDLVKMLAQQQPYLKAKVIEWKDGSIPILESFHFLPFFDDLWRGTVVSFSPSTLGFDAVSSWQMFSFLSDLGPVYAIWFLEASREGNAWTPAYFPTIFAFSAQLFGLGTVAPLFYFLMLNFSLSSRDLAASPTAAKIAPEYSTAILPVILIMHIGQVFAAFLSPDPATRHYWTWALQMSPLYIGIAITALGKLIQVSGLQPRILSSPGIILVVLSAVSGGVWLYTLISSPFSLATMFIPLRAVQNDFVGHMRRALQIDEIAVFASTFLWLAYLYRDMWTAGLLHPKLALGIVVFPVLMMALGPGATVSAVWLLREMVLQRGKSGN